MGSGSERIGPGAVGGVAANPERRAGAGDTGTDRVGKRGGREYSGSGRAVEGDATDGLSVASALRRPGFGRFAQPAARRAATTHYCGAGASGGQRDFAQAEQRDPLERAATGQGSGLVPGHGAPHLAEYGLQPHRVETFKFSRDPDFDRKLADVVGLYLDPPERALVLCVDEKSQIQALNRTQRALPMWPGLPARRTHDYIRHGTTSLFAALEVASGKVHGWLFKRHTHVGFVSFLASLARRYPKLDLHPICDNYGTHKHPAVKQWLTAHPRFHLHFTPTSASWLNLVERWFGLITDQAIRRGSFDSVHRLEAAIVSWLNRWNDNAKPFRWTKSAANIKRSIHNAALIYEM
jgi:hypothetical protein